jgi:hypothetical protein
VRDPVSERRAVDQLQYERLEAVRFFKAVDPADVGMVQRGEDLGFAFEANQAIGIEREGFRQDLHRDVATELRVARTIDLSHFPRPKEREDLVGAETGARRKRHRVSRRVGKFYPLSVREADRLDEDPIKKCVQTTGTRVPAGYTGQLRSVAVTTADRWLSHDFYFESREVPCSGRFIALNVAERSTRASRNS